MEGAGAVDRASRHDLPVARAELLATAYRDEGAGAATGRARITAPAHRSGAGRPVHRRRASTPARRLATSTRDTSPRAQHGIMAREGILGMAPVSRDFLPA